MLERPGRRQAGSLLLFGVWEIISSLLQPQTKLIASLILVAASLLSLANTAAERSVAVFTTLFALSMLYLLIPAGM